MKLTVLHSTGKTADLIVRDEVFAAKVNKPLLAQAVRVFLSNQRQGTSSSKTRSDVARTKKKWFKQKGTGNARHGARSANIFVGGGVVHGPTGNENWNLSLSKNMRKQALASALSAQIEKIVVTTMLGDIQPKTKDAHAYLQRLAPNVKKVLIVVDQKMENIYRSTKNLPYVQITSAARVNIYELLLAQKIILTKEAVHQLEARILKLNEKPEIVEKKVAKVKEVVQPEKKPVVKKTIKKPTSKKPVKSAKKVSVKK